MNAAGLKKLRKTFAITQGKLASAVGAHVTHICQLEKGHRPITDQMASRIKSAFRAIEKKRAGNSSEAPSPVTEEQVKARETRKEKDNTTQGFKGLTVEGRPVVFGDRYTPGQNMIHIHTKLPDPVNHPAHYTFGKIEVIEALEDWQLPFHLANAVKYIARQGRKPGSNAKTDLEKAKFYITRYIEKVIEKEK